MGNTVTTEKLLQELDEKLETKSVLYRVIFYIYLNQYSILNLENYKRKRTSPSWKIKKIIASCKKQIQQYKDEICLLRLDLQIEETDEIKNIVINYCAQIFYEEVFEKMCTFEFSNNDFITEKWIKDFCEKLVYLSDFYAQKAERMLTLSKMKKSKKENSDKLPTYEEDSNILQPNFQLMRMAQTYYIKFFSKLM